MTFIELIPQRGADGTIVLRATRVSAGERLRRWLRRLRDRS
jgi:hypothetical protein